MKYIIDINDIPKNDHERYILSHATPLNDCTDAISREEVIKASSKLCVSDECCKCQFDENAKCRLKSYRNYIKELPSVNPTSKPFINKPCCISEKVCHEDKTETLDKIRAEIEPKCDRIYNLISIYPYAERRDIQEMLCEIMDLCDAESEHKRLIDADELLKRIAEKCKTPSLSENTVNGLSGATAIIYDMLNESEDKE